MGRYEREIGQLTGWFENRLGSVEPFQMTEEDYLLGTDRLPEDLRPLIREAINQWLNQRKYSLSYRQLCRAFFLAAHATKKIVLIPKHETFRLHTPVLIREVSMRGTGEKLFNVPGTITSVCGDNHVVTSESALGNDRAGKWCVIIRTDQLEEQLALRS